MASREACRSCQLSCSLKPLLRSARQDLWQTSFSSLLRTLHGSGNRWAVPWGTVLSPLPPLCPKLRGGVGPLVLRGAPFNLEGPEQWEGYPLDRGAGHWASALEWSCSSPVRDSGVGTVPSQESGMSKSISPSLTLTCTSQVCSGVQPK